jgi:VWFA-related protein
MFKNLIFFLFLVSSITQFSLAQTRTLELKDSVELIEIENYHGRVSVMALENLEKEIKINAKLKSAKGSNDIDNININQQKNRIAISVSSNSEKDRIDLEIKIPENLRVRAETKEGEILFSGKFVACEARTETGTIITDIPTENIKYSFLWLSSYPRFMSNIPLAKVKEKAGGRFVISGELKEKREESEDSTESIKLKDSLEEEGFSEDRNKISFDRKGAKEKSRSVTVLDFKTSRGIILFNVPPSEVPSDLREKPLTEAAKAIIRSGDGLLMEAVRRVSPKYFGDYARTLPPRKSEPVLKKKDKLGVTDESGIKTAIVRVLDNENRAVNGLGENDFIVLEDGQQRQIVSVEQTTTPMNLVLLIDVSGSVENYADFLRRAARAFIETMDEKDSIAIIAFNEDVKILSDFTTDRQKLSESVDELDTGGGTAYYDALAFTLVEVLRPLKGKRTAIIILSDGDDNRSFLPFESLLGSIQESGALIYPLYVPSGLIASSSQANLDDSPNPVWAKYMTLTSKAQAEGARLAEISGGVYYPIRRLSDIQRAYEDVVVQLRSAYVIRFYSKSASFNTDSDSKISPRIRIRTKNERLFVNVQSVN